ncbi:MAG TPA: flavin reductase family protein [Actinomycetota bacterium]|nr:flavin reductase family protein [Actinomycetota bacterium]
MAVSPDAFRGALRRFASGVTIVTVAAGDELHGMTASSFASVSLSPPLVLVCLDKASRTLELVSETGSFAVNVLAAGQQEASAAFARPGVKPFASVPHGFGSNGAPVLDEAIAVLECTTHRVFEAGDHEVVLGEVTAATVSDGDPLVYYDGAYRSLSSSTES